MTKNEFIELRKAVFRMEITNLMNEYAKAQNLKKMLIIRDEAMSVYSQSLEEAWYKGAMQGYKEGIQSEKNIKEIVQST